MITFLKANISSSIASFLDYLITIFLVGFFKIDVVIASATGTICGGVINFLIGRNWVFQSKKRKAHQQAIRYGIVWAGNLLLNTGGMWVVTKILKMHFVAAKLFVSFTVGFLYNYNLQKRFVFKNS